MHAARGVFACLAVLCTLAISISAQITRAHFPGLDSVCRVDPASYRSLPNGFERSIASPYSSTKVKGRPHPEAERLARCQYVSLDPEFDRLLGHAPTLYQIGDLQPHNFAFEGGAYLPATDEVIVTADFTSAVGSKIYRLSLATGNLTEVPVHPPLIGANGVGSYKGQLAVAVFSDPTGDQPSGLVQLDPYTGSWQWLTNNFMGLRYTGVDDVVALSDGSLIFTDYAVSEHDPRLPAAQLPFNVYILPPGGLPRVLINSLPKSPNGVCLSPDGSILYVSSTPAALTEELLASTNVVYAFDLVKQNGGWAAKNQRPFASVDYGISDGFKVDGAGRLYTSSGSGVQVFAASGKPLGTIVLPPQTTPSAASNQTIQNVIFAGSRLVIPHHQNVLLLNLNTYSSVPPMNAGWSWVQRMAGALVDSLSRGILLGRGRQPPARPESKAGEQEL